jgi:hypothetical protein
MNISIDVNMIEVYNLSHSFFGYMSIGIIFEVNSYNFGNVSKQGGRHTKHNQHNQN